MTGMREIATALRERADFVDRDTYDECWEVKETPHGALLRQAASAIDSLSSQVAELNWRPIETAPRDGTRIHLAVIDRAGNVLADTGKWIEGDTHEEWDEVEDGVSVKLWEEQEDGHWSTNYCLCELEEPTHWRPFVEPPYRALASEQTGG